MGSLLSSVITNFFMADFEVRALAQATHKPLCWFHYVDDTFAIWLERFLNHLNGLHRNIHFTMEKETEGHLPFLGINIYRRWDGSLGHKIYRKPTHTDLYLNPGSHHHPSSIKAVVSMLVHRGRALCDKESLHDDFKFHKTTFRENSYSIQQIRQALNPAVRTNICYCLINFNFVYFYTAFLIQIPIKMESQHCSLKCRSLTHNFPIHLITQTMSIDSLTRYAHDGYSNMVQQTDFQVPLTLYVINIPCKAL